MGSIKRFIKSLYTAFQGVVYVVQMEHNARLHLLIAIVALLLGVLFKVSNSELAAIFFAIILVFTTEIVNTALEKTLDIVESGHSEQVRIIKDIAAGAVLVTAIGAVAIGVAIFGPYIVELVWPL